MFVFGTDSSEQGSRGAYREVWVNGTDSGGTTLALSGGTYPNRESSQNQPLFVTDISMTQKERFSVVQCFNDRNYVYAFGHDPMGSMLTMRFAVFLGSCGSGDGDAYTGLNRLLGMYKDGRLTQSLKPAVATIGMAQSIFTGFVVGMSTSTMNAQLNLQSFEVNILLPRVSGGIV